MSTGLSDAWARARVWVIAVCVTAILLIAALAAD